MNKKTINIKAGKSSNGLCSSTEGLRESNRPRHYNDTTHNYGNFFGFRELGNKENSKTKVLKCDYKKFF